MTLFISSRRLVFCSTQNIGLALKRRLILKPSILIVSLSTNDKTDDRKMINVYKGFFSANLKWLKRFSVSTSLACIVGLPLLLLTSPAAITMGGKVAIAGTALLTSVSSTSMLQYCTSPYIISLEEIKTSEQSCDRRLVATRLSVLGFPVKTEFRLSEVELITRKVHPFATFKLKGNNSLFFVYGKMLEDIELRERLTGLGAIIL
jgi:hypothetical protein